MNPLSWPLRLPLGLAGSALVALLAYRRGSLSRSGVAGALLIGTLTLGFGGWSWGLTLIAFFVSSTFLTHWRRERKAALGGGLAPGGPRDLGQTLANGGLGAGLAIVAAAFPHPVWAAAFAGSLAAATADTWATEVGMLSPTPPRLIITGRPVAPGTSGGVTAWGTGAALGGALFLGGAFYLLTLAEWGLSGGTSGPVPSGWVVLPVLIGGLAGVLTDSLLGATLQGSYRCSVCGKETEKRAHCGRPSVRLRGRPWMTNDGVNLGATLIGAAVAGGVCLLVGVA